MEYICGKKFNFASARNEYLVKWIDYNYKDGTWEPFNNIKNNDTLVS